MSPATRLPNGSLNVDVLELRGNPPGPVERVVHIRAELPCPGCAHRVVCAIRPMLEEASAEVELGSFPLNDAIRITGRLTVTCAHYLVEGQPARPATPAKPPSKAERVAASRRRGAEVHRKVAAGLSHREASRAVDREAAAEPGHTYKRSPEQRAAMRAAMFASYARRRAEAAET